MTEQPHILVVDDHREIRDAVTRYLEKNGMRATSAHDAIDMDAATAATIATFRNIRKIRIGEENNFEIQKTHYFSYID